MKKITNILVALSMLVVTTACNSQDKDFTNTNSEEQYNSYYNVQMEDGLLFYDAGNNASILDYETMETSLLCNIPSCTHTTSQCLISVLKSDTQLPVIYNNCAYYFSNYKNFTEEDGKQALDLKTTIMKYDFNKMEMSKVVQIDNFNANEDCGCYLIGSDYYFTTNYGNPNYDDLGNVSGSSNGGGGNLFCVNLETCEVTDFGEVFDYELLKEEYPAASYSTSMSLLGKNNSEICIQYSYFKDDVTIEMSERGDTPTFYATTCIFYTETRELKTLKDGKAARLMNNYYTYFRTPTDNTLMIKNIETGEVTEGPSILNPKILTIFNHKAWYDSKCYDIKTGIEKTVTDLNMGSVFGVYEDNYIIQGDDSEGNSAFEKIPFEEIEKLFSE